MAVSASQTNPLGEVVALLTDLSAKVTKEGEAEAKAFAEYTEWCDDTFANTGFEIKTAKSTQANLEAQIDKLTGDISAMDTKIGGLAADIASASAELKDATLILESEASDAAA